MSSLSSTKTAVKDSFEEDDASDDVEDDVFIRDGRNGYKIDDEMGAKRPLMAPRRKCRPFSSVQSMKKRERCTKCCARICKTFVCCTFTACLITLVVLFSRDLLLSKWTFWPLRTNKSQINMVPTIDFNHKVLWMQSFPRIKSETSITMAKLNDDDIQDIIIGFSTGGISAEGCRKVFCGGGAHALDGQSGSVLWTYWVPADVFFVDCIVPSANNPQCVLSGRSGVLSVVDGRTGELIWEKTADSVDDRPNDYSAQFIADVNDDNTRDLLVSHTVDTTGYVAVISGRQGAMLGKIAAPDGNGLYTVPRSVVGFDGSSGVIFATGSRNTAGGLFYVPLYSVLRSDNSACKQIWNGPSGVSSGIVLADMNKDKMEDIIITTQNKMMIFDGNNFTLIWNITLKDNTPSEILSGPTPAYFDEDDVPDLLVTIHVGPTFGSFFYSETQVFSGADGSPLLDPIISAGAVTSPGIAVSFDGAGNDMFLLWLATCGVPAERQKQPFSFPPGVPLPVQLSADQCSVRFNQTTTTRLHLLSERIEPPGVIIYSSDKHWNDEHKSPSRAEVSPTSAQAEVGTPSFRNKFPLPNYLSPEEEEPPALIPQESSIGLVPPLEPLAAFPESAPQDFRGEQLEYDGSEENRGDTYGAYDRNERLDYGSRRTVRSLWGMGRNVRRNARNSQHTERDQHNVRKKRQAPQHPNVPDVLVPQALATQEEAPTMIEQDSNIDFVPPVEQLPSFSESTSQDVRSEQLEDDGSEESPGEPYALYDQNEHLDRSSRRAVRSLWRMGRNVRRNGRTLKQYVEHDQHNVHRKRQVPQQSNVPFAPGTSLPQALATPSLAPSLSGTGIDVVFATHWMTVPDLSKDCRSNNFVEGEFEMRKRSSCGGVPTPGQLTVYRANIEAVCTHFGQGERCSLPAAHQGYPRRTPDVYFWPKNL